MSKDKSKVKVECKGKQVATKKVKVEDKADDAGKGRLKSKMRIFYFLLSLVGGLILSLYHFFNVHVMWPKCS